MIGAYQATPAFAYPGWRLTVPGGPAGGHYKGFTHTQAAGTDIPPNDPYEQDREDGMSSHDEAHASPRNPRGVYRSSAEVPPRPNASGAAHTYRGMQTRRHAGTSVAPGSFPADYFETPEDAFLHGIDLGGLGLMVPSYEYPSPPRYWGGNPPVWFPRAPGLPVVKSTPSPMPPTTGATSVVAQPPPTPLPLPPTPAVPIASAPPISPAPAPVVATNEVVPLNDGSGNYLNISTGTIVPASSIAQNPATGQLTTSAVSGALTWLEENTLFPSLPNWGVVSGGLLLAMMFFGGSSGGRKR
jgi:hypothetical protein